MKTNLHWLIAAGAAFALNSCSAKNQYSSLEILKLVPPTSTAEADAAGAAMDCGFLAATAEYSMQQFNESRDFYVGVVVQNNLADNANSSIGRHNTNDFIAMQAVTTNEATDGTSISIPEQITPTQGTITVGQVGVVGAVLIPAAVAAKLASDGVTSVRLHTHIEGRLLDGSSVSTNEYLPIAVPTTSNTDTSSCVFAD